MVNNDEMIDEAKSHSNPIQRGGVIRPPLIQLNYLLKGHTESLNALIRMDYLYQEHCMDSTPVDNPLVADRLQGIMDSGE